MSMKTQTDGIDENLIDPGEPFIDGVIAELSGTDSEKSANSSQHTGFLSEFVID